MVTPGCDPIERLRLNGTLIEKQEGVRTWLRFSLDRVAEVLGARGDGDECELDEEKWEMWILKSQAAPGFQSALKLVRQEYTRAGER